MRVPVFSLRLSSRPFRLSARMASSWTAAKVREEFFTYFKSKSHTYVPSSATIPYEDPTLLFANAGMNQVSHKFISSRPLAHPLLLSTKLYSLARLILIRIWLSSSVHSIHRSVYAQEASTMVCIFHLHVFTSPP